MSEKETPTQKHLKTIVTGFDHLLKINKLLGKIGLGSASLRDMEPQLDELKAELETLTSYPRKFNEYFAKDGWLAHDSLSVDAMKEAVDAYEQGNHDTATQILLDYYSPDNINSRLMYFTTNKYTRMRRHIIDAAAEDYARGRHISAVPLLLMVIDGMFNDATGTGFHSDASLELWDSSMTLDGAFKTVHDIYRKGRQKTRTDKIFQPHRNGILHGMDLGYGNQVVAAKCWCILFAVRDWTTLKSNEDERKTKFEEETRPPSFRELARKLRATQNLQDSCSAWKPRALSDRYLEALDSPESAQDDSPEETAIAFMQFWQKRNYGGMANCWCTWITSNPKKYAGEVRAQYDFLSVKGFKTKKVHDSAPAAADIDVEIQFEDKSLRGPYWRICLNREDDRGEPVPVGMDGGKWRVVNVNERRDDSEGR